MDFRHSQNPGKDVSTAATSRTVTGSAAIEAATDKDIAIRWSPWLSTVPPVKVPPCTTAPSSDSSTATPSARNPSAIAAIRSLSLTRSSPMPENVVLPFATEAAANNTGNSSMASDTSARSTGPPCKAEERTRISATGSSPSRRGFWRLRSAPMLCNISMTPVRVGFIPTFSIRMSAFSAISPASMTKAADDRSPGTWMPQPRNTCPPSMDIRLPAVVTEAPMDRSILSV